jgi:hypothetical protein
VLPLPSPLPPPLPPTVRTADGRVNPRTPFDIPAVSLPWNPCVPSATTPSGLPRGSQAVGRGFVGAGDETAGAGMGLLAIIHGCVLGISSSAGKSSTQSGSMNS